MGVGPVQVPVLRGAGGALRVGGSRDTGGTESEKGVQTQSTRRSYRRPPAH